VRNIFLKIAVAALFQKEKIKGKLLLGLLILFYSIGAKDTRQGGRIMVYFEKQEKERIEMKMISWNVNGLRAAVGKGFLDYFKEADADIFSIQETKLQEGQIDLPTEGYHQYWNYAEKKGYSGVAVFTKQKPISVSYGLGIEEHDKEGRVITLEFENFYHVTVYTPNSQQENARLDYRMTWDDAFRAYLQELDKKKPVIVCGDLNVAHTEIDLKNPSTNRRNAGFTDEERGKFTELLEAGFVDTFRHFYPDLTGAYSWWSYRFNARKNNAGWRIDYYVVSERLKDALQDAKIHSDIMGSDHCPVELDIAL
jgi:exodeoxyribonuclease III